MDLVPILKNDSKFNHVTGGWRRSILCSKIRTLITEDKIYYRVIKFLSEREYSLCFIENFSDGVDVERDLKHGLVRKLLYIPDWVAWK